MANRFGIASLDEARAYLAHPLLGPRLGECVQLMLRIDGRVITDILGTPDDMKFRSCMTLFEAAAPAQAIFGNALRKYCGAIPDARTLELLRQQGRPRLHDPDA
jgi:uncharacterized protein (DUF1810 family)